MERLNGKVKQLQQEIRNLNGEIEDKEQKVGAGQVTMGDNSSKQSSSDEDILCVILMMFGAFKS